jgi:hypothetical protein
MPDYAKLDSNNAVEKFNVVAPEAIITEDGIDPQLGSELLSSLHGGTADNYVIVDRNVTTVMHGWVWHPETGDFRPERPFTSWTFNEEYWEWQAPVAKPTEGVWDWDENAQQWNELIPPTE